MGTVRWQSGAAGAFLKGRAQPSQVCQFKRVLMSVKVWIVGMNPFMTLLEFNSKSVMVKCHGLRFKI